MKNIEVEFRARFSREKHDSLEGFLDKNARDLGQDDKDSVFYALPDKLFKVVDEKSQQKAKLVLKDSAVYDGNSSGEWELAIDPADYEKAVELFDHLGLPGIRCRVWQERRNYLYKEVEIALKYSEYWEHHAELEIMVSSPDQVAAAEARIRSIATELGLELMSEQELADFTRVFESRL